MTLLRVGRPLQALVHVTLLLPLDVPLISSTSQFVRKAMIVPHDSPLRDAVVDPYGIGAVCQHSKKPASVGRKVPCSWRNLLKLACVLAAAGAVAPFLLTGTHVQRVANISIATLCQWMRQGERQQQQQQHVTLQSSNQANSHHPLEHFYVPGRLSHVLVTVTFYWDVRRLAVLEIVLKTAATYRTNITVVLVTNNADSLKKAVARMSLRYKYTFWDSKPPADKADGHGHGGGNGWWLMWEHKKAIKEAVAKGNYTSVLHLEDDYRVTWQGRMGWCAAVCVDYHQTATQVVSHKHPAGQCCCW